MARLILFLMLFAALALAVAAAVTAFHARRDAHRRLCRPAPAAARRGGGDAARLRGVLMAERFGGRYSPGAKPPQGSPQAEAAREALAETRRVDAAGARANLLFVPPVVAAFAGLFRDPASLLLSLAAAGVLALAAWLLREGVRPE